jgi:Leucine-rich repeat (LRR) protein
METDIHKKILKAQISKATELNLSKCGITVVPEEIGELINLTSLDLRENQIQELPKSFSNLVKLERLHLRTNAFSEFPEVILNFTLLEHLCLSENRISKIPDEINRLRKLDDFQLADNKLKELPENILELSELKHLCLNDNEIEFLPQNINLLKKITKLHLSNNKLTKLPFELNNADFISHLSLQGNPLLEPSMEIINQGHGAILNYFLEKEKGRIFKIPINSNLKTALKQYLVFFNDFVSASKGIQVNFEVKSYQEGIELDLKVNSEQELLEIQKYLDEYISFTKTNIENLKPEFKTDINENQKDILIADLKNQVRSLQSSLEIRSLENKFLNRESAKFYNLLAMEKLNPQPLLIQSKSNAIANSVSKNEISIEIKNELPKLQNEIFELKKILGNLDEKTLLNELENVDAKILEIEECEPEPKTIDKTPFKKLKRILDEINNVESTLGKAIKATSKTIEVAKKLGKTYNKFAQWLALPQVPDIFVD